MPSKIKLYDILNSDLGNAGVFAKHWQLDKKTHKILDAEGGVKLSP